MPCYSPTNVDQQRGNGVFDRSIKGLQALNAVGYGQPGSGLQLDLVYNPNGIFLAPAQSKLEVWSYFCALQVIMTRCAAMCCALLCSALLSHSCLLKVIALLFGCFRLCCYALHHDG